MERPKFEQVGPFMYKQWRRREIVDLLDNNRKVTYREIKTFYPMFPKELENSPATKYVYYDTETNKVVEHVDEGGEKWEEGKGEQQLNDKHDFIRNTTIVKMLNPYAHNLTLINLPLLSVLTQLAQLEEGTLKRTLAAKIASRLIENGREKILITRRANQFLFDGYKVGLMDAANDLISNTFGYNFESPLPRNKFGFFHTKNNTWSRKEAGEMTIFSGRNNSMDEFMLVDSWNGLKVLNVWPRTAESGNRCNEIKGTDGSQFHPGVSRSQILSIFSPMICTSIYVKYKEDTSVRDIPLLRFTTPPDVFAAPKKNAQNSCYCTVRNQENALSSHLAGGNHQASLSPSLHSHTNAHSRLSAATTQSKAKITNARCYLDGLMDLSLCQRGAPVAVSSPHFYNSDPMLAMAAGLEPNKEKHETYLDIEPMTGAVMRAASRAQLNAFVEEAALNVVDQRLIGHMTPMVAPLIWFEEAAQIDEKSSNDFKNQLLNLVQKAKRTFYTSIIIGVIIVCAVGLQFWYVTCYKIGKRPPSTSGDKRRMGPSKASSMDSKRTAAQRRRTNLEFGQVKSSASSNARDLTGARRANMASSQPLILGLKEGALRSEADKRRAAFKGRTAAAAAAVGVAAALGAADAAATHHRMRTPERRQPPTSPDYEHGDLGDDDELSRRALVSNEWPAPEKGGQTSPEGTSGSLSSGGGGQQMGQPSTSQDGAEQPGGPNYDSD